MQRPDPVPGGDGLRDVRQAARAVAELKSLGKQGRQLIPGDAAHSRAENGNEPPTQECTHHLVVVVLERRRADAYERALLSQDRSVERLELRSRIDPELVDKRAPRVVVGIERLSLPTGSVEREHELATQSLTQWVATDEGLHLGYQIGVGLDLEVGRDPVLEHAETEILQAADLGLCEILEFRVGKRRTAPKRERLSQ